jgi:L-iditol 2-dehydrogenase
MGHEYAGTVVEVGSGVEGFAAGDRVVSLTAIHTCGHCRYCYEGLLMLCADRLSIGSGRNGAFAEYLVIPSHLAFHIPEGVSLEAAALSEPLACVVRGVIERADIKAGDYALVSGPGAIGQLALQCAKASGARVVVSGTSQDAERLALSRELGADATIIVDAVDMAEAAAKFTGGAGFDIAFECAGAASSAGACLRALRKHSQYAQIGIFGKPITFDMDMALLKEIRLTNSFASERTSWNIALRLLADRKVDTLPLISGKFALEDWEEAFRMAENREGYKILFLPGL